MDDRELLEEFVKDRSQSAFHELVTRHLPVVYSAARRMVQDAHLAEEVAQSVFATLAEKADAIRPPQVIAGWLYNTTRHLAMHALRTEQRRRVREQIACRMQSLDPSSNVPDIADQLEPAMAKLDADDRDALVLRYLGNRALRDVGAELGISEDAARKRVSRALERLRLVLGQRGIATTPVLLATALASSILAVPVGLGATIAATAFIPASASAATVTNVTVAALKTKTMVVTIAAMTIAGVGTAVFLPEPKADPPAPSNVSASAMVPIRLANDSFVPAPGSLETIAVFGQQMGPAMLSLGAALRMDNRFSNNVAPEVRRTTNSAPAGHIKCLLEPTSSGPAEYLSSISSNRPLQACRYSYHLVTTNSPLLGKRIRASGWLKTSDVEVMAGATLLIINGQGEIFASDPMTDRPVRGTTDWKEIELIADVPNEPCTIYFGPILNGMGEIWADDFQIALAPADAAITDDRKWHVWSPNPGDYSVSTDRQVTHENRPSLHVEYVPAGRAPAGSWMWWGKCMRAPEQYRGHTVRMTVWIKSQSISGRAGPNLRPKGANFKLLVEDSQVRRRPIRGSSDWTLHSVVCRIPKGTQCLDTGFYFGGSGHLWIDMESLQYEIVDDEPR